MVKHGSQLPGLQSSAVLSTHQVFGKSLPGSQSYTLKSDDPGMQDLPGHLCHCHGCFLPTLPTGLRTQAHTPFSARLRLSGGGWSWETEWVLTTQGPPCGRAVSSGLKATLASGKGCQPPEPVAQSLPFEHLQCSRLHFLFLEYSRRETFD